MAGKKSQVYPKPAFDERWVYGTVDYITGEQGWERNFSTVDKDIIAFVYDDGGRFSWAVDVNGAQVASEWDRDSVEEAMAEAEEWVEAELAASVPFASRKSASDGWHIGDGYATKKYDNVNDWYNGDPYYGYADANGFNVTTSGGMILVEDDGYSDMEDAMEACDEHIEKLKNASSKVAATMGDNVRDWYMATFPTDDLGGDIYPDFTFSKAMLQLVNHPGEDFYDYIGVGDSLIRERIFAEAADILGCDYDVIYNAWLHGDDGSLKNVMLNHRASRKIAKSFPTLDEFKHMTGVFGDDRWVYEDDKFYMVIGKGLHGVVSDDTWGWEIAWADMHNDLIAIDLNDTYSLEECYQDLRDDAFSGRIHSLWYDDMKDVVFGSRKTAQEQVEVNITGEYCDGYVYIERNADMYDCEIEIEAWGDAGEEPVDAFVSVSADIDFFGWAREIIQEAEFEYGDELGIDVGELAGQLGLYFGKDAGRKADIGGDEAWENEIAELIASVLDLYDGDVASASDDTKMWLDERFAKAVELVRSGDVSASKEASSKKAYSDTFEYGFYDTDDEFRGGEVHIEDDDEGYGVWLVEIYGINGDSFEGYGSGDTPSQAARDAVENSDLKLSEKEIQDFLDHLEFSMTDPFEGGWEGEF